MTKQTVQIHGMHCASCANIITKKVSTLSGVKQINVNYSSEKAHIEFDEQKTSLKIIDETLQQLGYKILQTETNSNENELEILKSKTQFILPIALFTFILMLWEIAAKTIGFIPNLPIPMGIFNIINLILASITIFWIGQPFIQGVTKFIRHRVANMDTLIGIGTLTAYIYSAIITLFPQIRLQFKLPEYTYFDVTIVVIGFVILGKYLETKSKARTGEAIQKLLGLQSKTATIWRDNKEIEIPINEVKIGDTIIVKPGTKIPVDGKITEGHSAIDESTITGEPIPVDKTTGDQVYAATINKQGYFKFIATKVGSDTLLSQIIKMVEEAQDSKAPIQALADRISTIFVPIVLVIATISLITWLFFGQVQYGILSFVGVLVIACPCALGLATPTAITVGVGKGAEHGILIKNAESLERLSRIDTIVFDKTGTITKGQPEVTDIISLDRQFTKDQILELAASLEKMSEHPLAQAIVKHANTHKINFQKVHNFQNQEGIGIQGEIDNDTIHIHKPHKNESHHQEINKLQQQGKTVAIVTFNKTNIGLIALADTIKDGVTTAIQKFHQQGLQMIMLTGDNHLAAAHIAKQVGIDEVIAEVLPTEKAEKIRELQAKGLKVAMAGDGINDAPALVTADIGIAMATGSDIAIESAGITLLHGDLNKLTQAFTLAKSTMRTVKQNLFWAFIYNLIGIPIAAGLLYPICGITLNPIFAGLAMAFSSVSVVSNSLRLKTKKL